MANENEPSDFVKQNMEYNALLDQRDAQRIKLDEISQQAAALPDLGPSPIDFGKPMGGLNTDTFSAQDVADFAVLDTLPPAAPSLSAGDELLAGGAGDVITKMLSIPTQPRQVGTDFLAPATDPNALAALPRSEMEDFATGADVTQNTKIGSQTSLAPHPELDAAKSVYKQDIAAGQAAYNKEAKSLADLEEIARPIEARRVEEAKAHYENINRINNDAKRAYDTAREEATALRTEMANQPWNSFWDNQDTGNKILLTLSIGLGAYGQTLIGGKNVALDLINDKMKEHGELQKSKFQALRERLTTTSADAQSILNGAEDLQTLEKVRSVAAYDQLTKELDQLGSRVKTVAGQAKIQQASAAFKLKADEEMMNLEKDLAKLNTVTTDTMSSSITSVPLRANKTKNAKGELVDMTMEQAKMAGQMYKQAEAHNQLRKYEAIPGLLESPEYKAVWEEITNPGTGWIAKELYGAHSFFKSGGAAAAAVAKNPQLADYVQNLINSTDPEGRQQSQGVVNMDEEVKYLRMRMPLPLGAGGRNAQQAEITNKQKARLDEIKLKKGLSGALVNFHFEGAE
jgi:hypothetical protein